MATPTRPNIARPGINRPAARPVVKPAAAAKPAVVEEETAVDVADVEQTVVTESKTVVTEEAATPAPAPAAKKAVKPAKAAPAPVVTETATENGEEEADDKLRLFSQRNPAGTLSELEFAQHLVACAEASGEESVLNAMVNSVESKEERDMLMVTLFREMNNALLKALETNSVMMTNTVDNALPVYRRTAPGKEVVRNPSSRDFPANLIEGRVTVALYKSGTPLRVLEGTSTRIAAADVDATRAAIKAEKDAASAE